MSSEAKLGARVSAFLKAEGWDVFAEVAGIPGAGARRPDIVAVQPREGLDTLTRIVECKMRLSWPVLAQADAWRGWADAVYVATPPTRTDDLIARALEGVGIGWYVMHADRTAERVAPRLSGHAGRIALLLDALRPEHATYRPGNADGEYWTEHDRKAAELRRVVAADPGINLVDALRKVTGRTLPREVREGWARQCRTGLIPGVAARRDGRRWLLTPAETDVF